MNKYNVLLFPCGTEIANEIRRALYGHKYFKLFFANSEKDSYCDYIAETVYTLPYVGTNEFLYKINRLVETLHIDIIIPAHDEVMYFLSQHGHEVNAEILGPNRSLGEVLRFKDKTYKALKDTVPIPYIYEDVEELEYPVFVKPKRGQGSQGIALIDNEEQLKCFLLDHDPQDFLFMEYLPGKEYTIDCFSDKNSKVLYVGPRVRKKIVKGIAASSELIEDNRLISLFSQYAEKISYKLGLTGVWFFQMKEDSDGNPRLLEVANRVSGTMMVNRVRGVNFIELALYQLLGHDIEIVFNNVHVSIVRAMLPVYKINRKYDVLYVDMDDTLIFSDGKVNTMLVALIVKTKNENKQVFVITRTAKDIAEDKLASYGLLSLFDGVVHVPQDRKKSEYMVGQALLIDDSFRERKDAIEAGFLALGVDSIESLLKEGH